MQQYGCYAGAFLIMQDNPALQLELHSVLPAGVKYLVRTPVPRLTDTNLGVMEAYQTEAVQVVSGGAVTYTEENLPDVVVPEMADTFKPYVEAGYTIPGYVSVKTATVNYATSINVNLETE